VDVVAENVNALLVAVHGRTVRTDFGTVSVATSGAKRVGVALWWGEEFLLALEEKPLAVVLLVVGILAMLYELSTPGVGVAGFAGTVPVALGLFGLGLISIQHAETILVILSFLMFVAGPFLAGRAVLAVGGVLNLALGGIFFTSSTLNYAAVCGGVLGPVVLVLALYCHQVAGESSMPAAVPETMSGVCIETFTTQGQLYHGLVRVGGEIWRAKCSSR
jgi:membrane-bound serine protease (ClpP class)